MGIATPSHFLLSMGLLLYHSGRSCDRECVVWKADTLPLWLFTASVCDPWTGGSGRALSGLYSELYGQFLNSLINCQALASWTHLPQEIFLPIPILFREVPLQFEWWDGMWGLPTELYGPQSCRTPLLPTAHCTRTGGHRKPNFNTGHASPLLRVEIAAFGKVAGPGKCPGNAFSTVGHRGVRSLMPFWFWCSWEAGELAGPRGVSWVVLARAHPGWHYRHPSSQVWPETWKSGPAGFAAADGLPRGFQLPHLWQWPSLLGCC